MAGATIKVRDAENGTIDMDVIFNPDIDNASNAHKLVQRFIEFINQDQTPEGATQGTN